MNQNPDITGGAGEQVVDILENIPSDSERRAATEGYRFRRPTSSMLFRPRTRATSQEQSDADPMAASIDTDYRELSHFTGEQSAGEEPQERPEERRITAVDVQKKESDIYNISGSEDDEQIDPVSNDYIGIIANYFSVGLMIGGSTSILYPVLIVKAGATASLMTASYAVVMVFWSYKVFFGFLSDCFPIFGYKRKPYIVIGWLFCAGVLLSLANEGNNVDPRHLVIMLSLANMGYVWADVAADGFMVWVAHREPIEKRGKMQTLVYSMNKLGQVFINVIILLGFSGPENNCVGFESDPNVLCSTNIYVTKRVDPELYQSNPYGWCYEKCKGATFDWDMSISEFALSICFVIAASMPLYLRLKEDKVTAEPRGEYLKKFLSQVKRRACWQIILYGMISHITFGVMNAAKMPANYVWLNLHTFQYQIMVIFEKVVFFIGLNLVRRYALNTSWRKSVLIGSFLVLVFNSMYFLIIFDVWRNAWFYIFTDVSALFMYTLNFLASHAAMVEVAEPGYEAITYSLITTATNAVSPLSAVISYQLLAFFPSLNDQESIATDTPQVRKEFACLHALVIILNLSSLLSIPLLPRQKKETRELVAKGETSTFWGTYVICSALTFLCYSSIVTFITVKYHDLYGCMKILGGGGCSANESSAMALGLVSAILLYCYGTTFYLSYLPILKGEHKFSWRMFI
mmetsp:Transcript_14450/g.31341  ORF Transcript_14450/g.31341 Transcript_14450/m.31341 type:complete len:689 (+) Transcript_14450:124-2190(+)|eukprot:CAMPEP_0172326252 /NCGR_PEP_ID=MMETSP1058-20130122/56011_1 /TAXON_ID=83371 /ORGANISM="Detonula confervacea, Strain CCMP 353" /LENGTH=688 /DNA_ID=CAMNT_0013042995 /DNA_START=52 /DNA_END=2118 /DNA_ORIENTATION=-